MSKKEEPKESVDVTEVEEEIAQKAEEVIKEIPKKSLDVTTWNPKTSLGNKVKEGEIKSLSEILDKGLKILESEIVDALIPDLSVDLLLIGQAKGKFGGGQRRIFRQTQKKTAEGNKPSFATCVVVGNKNGYVGLGYGKARETVPAREKAIRNAKLNIIKIRRGCGSWQCSCSEPHSVPYAVEGKCGSVRIRIMPAPKGTGLCIENECQKILASAGIRDVWSKTIGQTGTKTNLVVACMTALKKLVETKIQREHFEMLGIAEGELKEEKAEA
jgi:small subunit ribosomal protein S5